MRSIYSGGVLVRIVPMPEYCSRVFLKVGFNFIPHMRFEFKTELNGFKLKTRAYIVYDVWCEFFLRAARVHPAGIITL